MPPVTILICTRDRGDSIVKTIRSILACTYPDFILLIVDQSDDTRTARVIDAFAGEPRLRYVHSNSQGLSVSLNVGLALSNTDFVIITDDDCEVPPTWIGELTQIFLRYPRVGVIFCNVVPAPHDTQAGFVPDCISSRSFLVEDVAHWQTSDGLNIGIGAGMAIRRSAAEAIGGFDPLFGSGSHFRSGNDTDFTLRALVAGYQVYHTHTVSIIHHGFRTYEQGRRLLRNNMYGLGGIYGRLLRRGHLFALRRLASIILVMIVQPALNALLHLRPPRVLGRIIWLIRGLLTGLMITPPKPTHNRSRLLDH
ncbi:glycosyltransferase family 2 protein [Oscillochloris sp. ZM17-4]|nr:glycosyltransferase family A protein [Oscillochloris sp. ZM17-4]MBX0330600.1 glycosyltransferase family 2 protein [Oscillochloris sp. ZM17-4]